MKYPPKTHCVAVGFGILLLGLGLMFSQNKVAGREDFLQVPGGRVWYRISGEGKAGVPLIALHGGPGADHSCMEVLARLSDERPVVLYDQLGGGKSDHPKDNSLWTVERFVKELAAVRAGLRLNQVHILGHSWGTMLAAQYMLTAHPSGVRSLILSGPCFSSQKWIADQRAYLKQFPEPIQKVVRDAETAGKYDSTEYQKAVDEFYRRHFCRVDPWPACLKRSVNMDVYGYMWGPSEFTATGTLKDFDCTQRVHAIKVLCSPAAGTMKPVRKPRPTIRV
jgi:proline iminopeptidase